MPKYAVVTHERVGSRKEAEKLYHERVKGLGKDAKAYVLEEESELVYIPMHNENPE